MVGAGGVHLRERDALSDVAAISARLLPKFLFSKIKSRTLPNLLVPMPTWVLLLDQPPSA